MLKSGRELEADLIVTATGLNLLHNFPCNAMDITVDGVTYDAPQAMVHRGVQVINNVGWAWSLSDLCIKGKFYEICVLLYLHHICIRRADLRHTQHELHCGLRERKLDATR